jgi:DNA-binding PadR family transcriptional regulator
MQARSLPALTHLQFLVLGGLLGGERPGRAIRDAIAAHDARRSGPAFYQMMARLERDGMVEGWYEQVPVGDQAVTERRYRIRPAGSRRWEETRAFYERVAVAAAGRERLSNA